jgi:signal transduction histidine kinase
VPSAGAFGGPGGPEQGGLPVPVTPARAVGRPPSQVGGAGQQVHSGSRWALSNWRVRWRLIAIIAVPTLTALVLGAIQISTAVENYTSFKRVQTLANLNALVVKGAGQLADERDITAGFVASGKSKTAMQAQVNQAQAATNATLAEISSQAAAVTGDSGYRAQTALDLSNGVLAGINDLTLIRQAALKTQYPPLAIIQTYDERLIGPFDTFSNDIAAGTGNASMQTNVTVLNSLLRMEDDASLQRAYLYQALASPSPGLTSVALTALNQAATQQQADTSQFIGDASVTEAQNLNNTVSGPQVDAAKSEESLAVALTGKNQSISTIGTAQTCGKTSQAECWYQTQAVQISDMRQVSDGLVGQVTAQANSLTASSLRSAIITSVVTLLLLILVLLITTFVARSMIRPLRKLRADALEVAGSKLPDMVRRLSESEGGDESVEIEPIGVTSTDEIGEVARAFDQVHREALRLAANEAALRGNVNAMFVNLSRRSQSLVERQIRLIDDLEQGEQDAERLANLFHMDHLATRMRRNSENLLVLAGHDLSKRWNQPVPLVDVLRAAVSEIEEYERVSLNVQPGIAVRGQAVNDVVHLLAELAENATSLSSADTPVNISGHLLTSGGVLLDITDQGVGMGAEEMAHANWRLDNPPVVDVAVSRRMGLFVVGRLAARHGIRVRLRPASSGGLTALVWLPDEVVTHTTVAGPGVTGFDTTEAATDELDAELAGLGRGDWVDPDRATTEQEVSAARTPKFASLRADDAEETPLGPRRVPGAALRPGTGWSATGSSSVFQPGARDGGVEDLSGAGPLPAGSGSGAATVSEDPMLGGAEPGQDELAGEPAAGPGPAGGAGAESLGTDARPAADGSGEPFGTVPRMAADSSGELFGTVPRPASGDGESAATERAGSALGALAPYRWETRSTNGEVIVPPAENLAEENRLPIFEAVESDWFRHGRNALGWSGEAEQPTESWASPADEGWRAAEIVPAPSSAGLTPAGLPKRVPQANLVPGSAASSLAQAPTRSAAVTRERFANFQRGVREARAAASEGANPDGEDETS